MHQRLKEQHVEYKAHNVDDDDDDLYESSLLSISLWFWYLLIVDMIPIIKLMIILRILIVIHNDSLQTAPASPAPWGHLVVSAKHLVVQPSIFQNAKMLESFQGRV